MRRIYLAGPEVFLPEALEIGARKKALCERYGFEGLFPFDNEITQEQHHEPPDRAIYRANVAMMRRADLGIVNLTPFRGPSADAGSVFELGMMVGLGKLVLGYTNASDDLAERVRTWFPDSGRDRDGVLRDPSGMSVEDFGNADNLMIDCCLADAGCPIVRARPEVGGSFVDLDAFETCLDMAARLDR